jgi:hypothetical protein
MDKSDIVSILHSILEEYDAIDSYDDLTRFVRERHSSESDLALFYQASFEFKGELFEHQMLHNQLKKLVSTHPHQEIASTKPSYGSMPYNMDWDSTALLRMAAYAYVKEYVTIFDVDYLLVNDFLTLASIDNSIVPYLRQFVKEYYGQTIQNCIERFHPHNHSEDDNEEEHNSESEGQYSIEVYQESWENSVVRKRNLEDILVKLSKDMQNRTLSINWFPAIRRETTEPFRNFMQDVFDGKLTGEDMINYVKGKTNSFQTDRLELLLFFVINYITSSPGFIIPQMRDVEKLKNDLIAQGEKPPTIERYTNNKSCLTLTTVDDIEKLFPEIFHKFQNFYQLRDIIVWRLQENYKIQKLEESQDLTNKKKRDKKDKPLPKQFSDFLKIDDETKRKAFAEFLIKELKGKGGKAIALWIRALKSKSLDNLCQLLECNENKVLYDLLRKEIDYNGVDAGINKYLNSNFKINTPPHNKQYKTILDKLDNYISKENIK